jgi:hypothetical protein
MSTTFNCNPARLCGAEMRAWALGDVARLSLPARAGAFGKVCETPFPQALTSPTTGRCAANSSSAAAID